jgi:cell division protein FtsI/penicillin-binding protein 2
MTRRDTLALMAGAAAAQAPKASLDSIFGARQGTAIELNFQTGRVVRSHRLETARALSVAPGSVIKPLVLLALMNAGKLQANEAFPCTRRLRIDGLSFACSHPRLQVPLDTATAIAYSCNSFVARVATRFAPGELGNALARLGLSHAQLVDSPTDNQLLALGERYITATAMEIAEAYRHLASQMAQSRHPAILHGLEQAVEYGTAQKAAQATTKVAGKTGTAPGTWAWFAGFAPSRNPETVVAVLVRGHAGGADAAPIAGQIFATRPKALR